MIVIAIDLSSGTSGQLFQQIFIYPTSDPARPLVFLVHCSLKGTAATQKARNLTVRSVAA